MIINTKYLGQIEIDDKKIITFPTGLPAFEKIKEYILLNLPENDTFFCLQSIQQPEIAFLLIHPWDFFPQYDIDIPQEDLEEINITQRQQVLLYNIVTIPDDSQKITANLMGPILINNENKLGKQVILHQENYHTKHPLIQNIETKEEV